MEMGEEDGGRAVWMKDDEIEEDDEQTTEDEESDEEDAEEKEEKEEKEGIDNGGDALHLRIAFLLHNHPHHLLRRRLPSLIR